MNNPPSMLKRMLARVSNSLVWNMTFLLICSTCVAWALFSAVLVWQSERMTHEILVKQHLRFAQMLWENMRDRDDLQTGHVHPLGSKDHLEFALYSAGGSLLKASSAPALPFQAQAQAEPRVVQYSRQNMLISSSSNDTYQLVVASPDNSAKMLSHELAEHVALLALLGLALLIPVLSWALRRGLRPIQRFTAEVATRAGDNLSPIQTPVQTELEPLKNRLNGLFSQVEQVMAREQRFTADAAHELRTPLAAIRLQLELAQNSQRPEIRDRAFTRATRAIDRTTHVVSQLLLLARLEHGKTIEQQPIDFAQLARDALAEAGLPDDPSHLRINGDAQFHGQPVLWGLVLRNLLDNTQRYAGDQAEVFITIEPQQLTVNDTGNGIPVEQMARLGERFYRPDQTQDGVGLGWSIIMRIAQLHHVQITPFQVHPHGFGVTFRFD